MTQSVPLAALSEDALRCATDVKRHTDARAWEDALRAARGLLSVSSRLHARLSALAEAAADLRQ